VRWRPEFDKLGRDRVQPLTEAARDALFVALGWSMVMAKQGQANIDRWVFPSAQSAQKSGSDGTYTKKSFSSMLVAAETRAGIPHIPYRGAHSLRRMSMGNALAVSRNIVDAMWWIGDTDLRQAKKYATERDGRMGDMATMLGEREGQPQDLANAVNESVPKPSRPRKRKSAPESAGALSTTTTRS
jgi:integrase